MPNMHNPPHPGALVRDAIEGLNLTVSQAADQLGVGRVTLSRVLNEHSAVSTDLAIRLEHWLGGDIGKGPTANTWLTMQQNYELWHARQKGITGVTPAPAY